MTSTIAVSGAGPFADALVSGLTARGTSAVSVDGRTPPGDSAAIEDWVHVCGHADLGAVPVAAHDVTWWQAGCDEVLWDSLTALQAAHRVFSERGGHVVMVTSTAGVSGVPQAAALASACEGTRAMAKSAARQWGPLGITVNCVAVPLELLAPRLTGLTSFLPPPAVDRADVVAGVAAAVEFLVGPGAGGVSGTTVTVDGGAVMAW